jgi:hypothetical protein
MACPGCSGTMQLMFLDPHRRIHHCPRCGATRSVLFGHTDDVVPKLVERCRAFARELSDEPGLMARWETLGIAESINPERQRG